MIILMGNQKGGCGKSTLAVNICAELARQGHDVVLVDADRQSTASRWIGDRTNNPHLSTVHCTQRYNNIRETLLDLDDRYEYVVVDAAGRDSSELRTGMTAADLLLVPFKPSQADLDTLPMITEISTMAMELNPKLRRMAILTMAPTYFSAKEIQEAKECLAAYPELTLCRTVIKDRKVYRDCMAEGKGVVEMGNTDAKGELQALVGEILKGGDNA